MTRRAVRGRRARRLRWTVVSLAASAVVGAGAIAWFAVSGRTATYRPGEELAEITDTLSRNLPHEAPEPSFVDVTEQAGLADFVQFAGPRSSQLPEDMGSGAAWGDYDNDGDDDLLLVAGGAALSRPEAERAPTRLYENLGDGTFRRAEGFDEPRIIGMGAAWGDYDGDGWLDLVITSYGGVLLYRNDGGKLVRDESFPDVPGYWAGAAWGDYDGDGDPDLYVCGYVRYVASDADRARATLQYGRSVPYTLNPASYDPQPNLLFRNDGQRGFVEVAAALGVDNPQGRSLSALWHDFDDDGWIDLYVANDISDNVLYRNTGGAFEEISHEAWVADYRGAMGLAVGDWDRDGDDDLFVSHWVAQENALYDSQWIARNGGPAADPSRPLRFVDVADQVGLGQIALRKVGWGAELADLDSDGWLDLVVANGSTFETDTVPPELRPQAPFVFWNRHGKSFHDLAPSSEALSQARVGRGLALSDFDGDGDVDLLFVEHGSGVRLLRNDMRGGHRVALRLRDRPRGGNAATGHGDGARVVARVGGAEIRRSVGGASYLSQSSRTLHLGLGEATAIDRLEVIWPDGERSVVEDLQGDQSYEWLEGQGAPRPELPMAAPDQGESSTLAPRERETEFWRKQRAAMDALKVGDDCATAIPLFREALALKPDHEDARYYLATCLDTLGDTATAIEELRQLTRVQPRSHRAFKQLGSLLAEQGELERATAALERALALNPEETGTLQVLGEVAVLGGDLDAADRHLEHVCRTNPKATGAFFLRAFTAWRRGDAEGSAALLVRARASRGERAAPAGTTSEGDVRRAMHQEQTLLSRFWHDWDGDEQPAHAFAPLLAYLQERARPTEPQAGKPSTRTSGTHPVSFDPRRPEGSRRRRPDPAMRPPNRMRAHTSNSSR